MNTANDQLLASESMGTSIAGSAILVGQVYGFSLHSIYTGTPSGTLKLQCSNDITTNPLLVANWSDISGAATTITAAGDSFFNVDKVFFKWIRVVYTRTSGTGALACNYFAKGV